MNLKNIKVAIAGFIIMVSSTANAGLIVSATNAFINSSGPGFGSINDVINQNGLSIGYNSGVTDFDTYIASAPSHTIVFSGAEWFSNSGSRSASVTFDLGALLNIASFALWNEEVSGIGRLNVFYSADNISFSQILNNVAPNNNPLNTSYTAEVFSFDTITTRYLRFDMSDCPQQNSTFDACALGEVAFNSVERVARDVPEPSTLTILALGVIGLFSRCVKKQ